MASEPLKVRTTLNPDVEIEVSAQEAIDLDRQGLLVKAKHPDNKEES